MGWARKSMRHYGDLERLKAMELQHHYHQQWPI